MIAEKIEKEVEDLLTHYPEKRSVTLMALHAVQEYYGYVSNEAIEWIAKKLGLEPISVLELVTFYPMFSQLPLGKFHFKVCRTLSCALGGSKKLYDLLCEKLGLDPEAHGRQTTPDGLFTVEFVECLANCNHAPTLMLNEDLYGDLTETSILELLVNCEKQAAKASTKGEKRE